MFRELEEDLLRNHGFDAVSLQPNSGAQGEFAWINECARETNNETHRNICLIPSSAHGTNPASANGRYENTIIKCDEQEILIVRLKN